MAINTNLQNLTPRRERFKKEITLLSKGFSSPKAWPNGKLTVFPWDNDIDSWLTSASRKGMSDNAVFFGLVSNLCDLNGGKIEDFVASEVLAVLLIARAIQSDCVLTYRAQCPNPVCRGVEDATITVPDELGRIGEKTEAYQGWDEITLPVSKDVVRLRPLLIRDEMATEQRPEAERALIQDEQVNILKSIVSVGGGAPERIEEVLTWYRALAPADIREFLAEREKLSPHLDVRVPHQCEKCHREFHHVLGLDKDFFR